MISSVPSYDEELLNSAYANIGLIADKGWAFYREDPFRKLNHTLWVQNCKLSERYRENGNNQSRFVRNTIPESRLAQYGNYEYNAERERMYKPGDNTPVVRQLDSYNGGVTEPWMLKEVEEQFARLSSRASLPLDEEQLLTLLRSSLPIERLKASRRVSDPRETRSIVQSRQSDVSRKRHSTLEYVDATNKSKEENPAACLLNTNYTDVLHLTNVSPEDYDKYLPPRYTIENIAEMQLQMRIASDDIRDLWNPLKSPQQQSAPQQIQQQNCQPSFDRHQQNLQCSRQQQHLILCSQQQHYLQCRLQHQTLPMRPGRNFNSCTESAGIIRRSPPPILSAEVPEFFPKGPICRSKDYQDQSLPLQFFPSSAERSYQDDLFPYNRGRVPGGGNIFQNASVPILQQAPNTPSLTMSRPSHQWIQRPSPGLQIQIPVYPSLNQSVCTSIQSVCPTIIQRQIQMTNKLPGNVTPQSSGLVSGQIPVYQRPPELYNDPSLQRARKNHGVDFNNLILLTKSAMKARRNQSKNPQQSSSFILESRQPNLKSETDVLQWLEKGYPKRAKEFVAVNTLVSDFRNFECKFDNRKTVTSHENIEDTNLVAKDISLIASEKSLGEKSNDADMSSDAPTKRRLYRDVLTNSSSSEMIIDNAFDKRYDELERQAMEQYRTSEECLALRYQELERQAMEQYRNSDNGSGSISNIRSQSSSPVTHLKGEQKDQSKVVTEEKECVDGHKCSGFGHCSPVKDSPPESKKGTQPRESIIILRSESESMANTSHHEDFHIKYSHSAVVTKSLTTLNQRFSRDSKNTIRGASGDKIDRTVQASPKRRLILMSPSKFESEATLSKKSDLEEAYALRSLNRHVSESYQQPEVIQTGGGDEKVTILRSSGSEGIRKQLFLANEELMDSSPESLGGIRSLEPATEENGPRMKTAFPKKLEDQIFDTASPQTSMSPSILGPQQEHQTISNRVTKNKKKQSKSYNGIAIEESRFHRPNSTPTLSKSSAFLSRLKKYKVQPVKAVPYNNLISKIRPRLKKLQSKLKPKSEWEKMFTLSYFEKEIYYLIVTANFLPCSLKAVQSTRYSIIHCSIAKVNTFIYRTAKIDLEKRILCINMLTIRNDRLTMIEIHELCLLSPFQVLPLWKKYKIHDFQDTIESRISQRKIQMNQNFAYMVNDSIIHEMETSSER